MNPNGNHGSAGWHRGSDIQSTFYPNGSGTNMQPHYANAYYAQGGYYSQSAAPQPMQITVPSPGFARNQPMTSLVPAHMRNRVGPARCGHEGCLFAGSHKEVEIHRMDRHLIFPPGWKDDQAQKKRKRGKNAEDQEEAYVDEEAQFRANGSVAILGTDTMLDSPEAIAAWLEDRKKRWPSAKRVAEKAQSRKEAIERGQIITEPQRLYHNTGGNGDRETLRRGRGRGRGQGKDTPQHRPIPLGRANADLDQGRVGGVRGRGRGTGRGGPPAGGPSRGRGRGRGGTNVAAPAPSASVGSNPNIKLASSSSTRSSLDSDSSLSSGSSTDSDDASGSDMDPVLDAVSSKLVPDGDINVEGEPIVVQEEQPPEIVEQISSHNLNLQSNRQHFKKRVAHPPRPAYNPFDQRPDLLRNLLKPDIQATISNLSQAIRFLVANDFLENVELKPGDADNVLVQPLDTAPTLDINVEERTL